MLAQFQIVVQRSPLCAVVGDHSNVEYGGELRFHLTGLLRADDKVDRLLGDERNGLLDALTLIAKRFRYDWHKTDRWHGHIDGIGRIELVDLVQCVMEHLQQLAPGPQVVRVVL